MKRKHKLLIAAISSSLVIVLTVFMTIYFLFLHHYVGRKVVNNWSKEDAFNINKVKTLEKKKDKDFVILNFADIQLCDIDDMFKKEVIHKEMTHLVNKVKPDLITLTGDQTWSNENFISLTSIISWLDEYKIPYAPTFGNHDWGNKPNSAVAGINFSCDLYENGKYSLFSRGPTNIGTLGNYVINIKEDGKIIKSLYLLNNGTVDTFTQGQLEWLSWSLNGLKNANNNVYTSGMIFMHKPIPEFYSAYKAYLLNPTIAVDTPYVNWSLSGVYGHELFDLAKSGGVTDIIAAHQHGNSFTFNYEDIRLTSALKTGETVSFYEDENVYLNGASVFRITSENVLIEREFVARGEYKM